MNCQPRANKNMDPYSRVSSSLSRVSHAAVRTAEMLIDIYNTTQQPDTREEHFACRQSFLRAFKNRTNDAAANTELP